MKRKMAAIILESAAEYNKMEHPPEFWNYYKGQTRMYNLVTLEDVFETLEDYGEESDIIEINIGNDTYKWNPILGMFEESASALPHNSKESASALPHNSKEKFLAEIKSACAECNTSAPGRYRRTLRGVAEELVRIYNAIFDEDLLLVIRHPAIARLIVTREEIWRWDDTEQVYISIWKEGREPWQEDK